MTRCLFEKCCLCIDLRTGCLIIAYLELAMEIILIGIGVMGIAAGSVFMTQAEDEEMHEGGLVILAVSVVSLMVVLLLFSFTVVLLVGLLQNRRGHVRAYLIYATIFFILTTVMFVAGLARSVMIGVVIRDVIAMLLSIYFVLVIRSYYYKMEDQKPAVCAA